VEPLRGDPGRPAGGLVTRLKATKYFRPEELDQHARYGFPRTPVPPEFEGAAQRLLYMLDRIRERLGRPLVITSGYRSDVYNKRVYMGRVDEHGKPRPPTKTRHAKGDAADLKAPGMTPSELHVVIKAMLKEGELPELGGLGIYDDSVHVDTWHDPEKPAGYVRTWDWRKKKPPTRVA
jgi:uncharacterized protein YcbK (DUF882 family)